jgi:hypothetical protein
MLGEGRLHPVVEKLMLKAELQVSYLHQGTSLI